MTIKQVVKLLQNEKQNGIPARYHCRAIMVKNIKQYCELLSELKKISDIRVISSSELFSSADVLPKYDILKSEKYDDEWVILTGVSEYLRLFSKKESEDSRFGSLWKHQAAASSTGRIIIPLWGCKAQWFDKSLKLNNDERQQDYYFDCIDQCESVQNMNLIILSDIFEQHISKLDSMKGVLRVSLQDWFEYWEEPVLENKDFVLVTKRYKSISTVNGDVSVHVISDQLMFIKENMPFSEILNKENCPEDVQKILFDYALKGKGLDEALLSILNMSTFSGIDIMGKWNIIPGSHKKVTNLWLNIHPDNSYLCHCFRVTSDISKICNCIVYEIFKVRKEHPEWIKEYKELCSVMPPKHGDDFFNKLDEIPEYESRLDLITNHTPEERVYLIRMAGNWLRNDPKQLHNSNKFMSIYPELYAYLKGDSELIPEELISYLSKYKLYKLENTLPDDEDLYFGDISTEDYDYRFSILSKYVNSDTTVLWIDALGVEWLSLINWTLKTKCDVNIREIAVTQAALPTETMYNKQWDKMECSYNKLDKLDKLAHNGVIDDNDYYVCIEEQISFISTIDNLISKLLNQYNRIIITGDHGVSRLAARCFHSKYGIEAPKDAIVHSHGRYCELPEGSSLSMQCIRMVKNENNKVYAVFKNYDHFKQSGFAAGANDDIPIYGEIHGGATPEEVLVPVIVVEGNKEISVTGKWDNEGVFKISRKKVKVSIEFSSTVSQLSMSIAGNDGLAVKKENKKMWDITFENLKSGSYSVNIIADNHIIDMPEITIKSALGDREGDLP